MAQTLDVSAFTNALNKLYPKGLEKELHADNPLLGWLPKTYAFEGVARQVRPLIGGTHGSANFAQALAAKGTPTIKDFTVTRKKDYVIGSVDAEAMMASRSQRGAAAQALKTSVDGSLYEFGRSMASSLWGNSGGSRGQIGSISTDTITLKNASEVVNFEIGMTLVSSENDGSASAHTLQTGELVVTAVDEDAGTVTCSQNITTGIAAADADDYLFRKGDFQNMLAGVFGWTPTTTPTTGDSWFGVDRSVHPTRLAGSRVVGSGTIEETVFDACARLARSGGRADTLWLNPLRFAELCKNIQAKVQYPGAGGSAEVGFSGFAFPGPMGMVKVMIDPNCPNAYGLLTRKEAWELACLGQCPHFAREDGRQFSREGSSDGIEYRLRFYGNLICKRTHDSAVITWA